MASATSFAPGQQRASAPAVAQAPASSTGQNNAPGHSTVVDLEPDDDTEETHEDFLTAECLPTILSAGKYELSEAEANTRMDCILRAILYIIASPGFYEVTVHPYFGIPLQ